MLDKQNCPVPETDFLVVGGAGGVSLRFRPKRDWFRHVLSDFVPQSLQPKDHPVQSPLQLAQASGCFHSQHEGAAQLDFKQRTRNEKNFTPKSKIWCSKIIMKMD